MMLLKLCVSTLIFATIVSAVAIQETSKPFSKRSAEILSPRNGLENNTSFLPIPLMDSMLNSTYNPSVIPDQMGHLVAQIPMETLRILRMLTVPVLNTSLYLPETILREMSTFNTTLLTNSSQLNVIENQFKFAHNLSLNDLLSSNHTFPNATWYPHMNLTRLENNLHINTSKAVLTAEDMFSPVQRMFSNLHTSLRSDNISNHSNPLDGDHLQRYLSHLVSYIGIRNSLIDVQAHSNISTPLHAQPSEH